MLRIVAFALHADPQLAFGKGISTEDEPDLWQRSLDGETERWIDLGMPNERRIRKACGKAAEVVLYCYGGNSVSIWWGKQAAALQRFGNLSVYAIDPEASQALAAFAAANMTLQCTVQDGEASVSTNQGDQVLVAPVRLN